MARGRMLNRKISLSKQVADLIEAVGPWGGLVYTWMIAHLDVEGRVHGDPDVIKATIFPRISGIDPAIIRKTSGIAHELGLIELYEAEGDIYISYPGFEANQVGLRKKREPASELPPPTGQYPADFRQVSGNDPEECRKGSGRMRVKGREGKGSKGKGREGKVAPSATHSALVPASPSVICLISTKGDYPITAEDIKGWAVSFPGVDVGQELRSMREWCISNPTKRKTPGGMRKFSTAWLTREQNRGGGRKNQPAPRHGTTKDVTERSRKRIEDDRRDPAGEAKAREIISNLTQIKGIES